MDNGIHLLVLTQDEKILEGLRSLMAGRGHDFSVTRSNDVSGPLLEKIRNEVPDSILLDCVSDESNAADNLRMFHEQGIAVPVIILSGLGDEAAAVRLIHAGAADYLPRGIVFDDSKSTVLISSIIKAIDREKSEHEKKRKLIALELSEERYRVLIEHSPVLILRFFHDDKIINFVNDGFCNYFYLPRDRVIGENLRDIFPDMNNNRLKKIMNTLTVNDPVSSLEISRKMDDGVRWQKWTIQGIFDKKGKTIEYQCIGEDITDIKAANEKLNRNLGSVSELKNNQDGDYFLTSLILEPLSGNHAVSDSVTIDFFLKDKKTFRFKNWKKSIGGDFCFSHTLYLGNKVYIVFLNADAMGKSMQGAGGVLVFGAAFRAIIDKARFSPEVQKKYPETWLKDSYGELKRIFKVFNGSMLISMVLGLVEENSGLLYYINVEHPWPVLYREGAAGFIDNGLMMRKIGLEDPDEVFSIKTCKLTPGDIIIVGSDGKDDILLRNDHTDVPAMNEDETLFLTMVEQGKGRLDKIFQSILSKGDLTDDLSMIRVCFRESTHSCGETFSNISLKDLYRELNDLTAGPGLQALDNRTVPEESSVPDILKQLIFFHEKNEDFEKALPYLEMYNEFIPEDTEFLFRTSLCYMHTGDYRKAEELAERVYLRDIMNIEYLRHYAGVLITDEKYTESNYLIGRILQLDPHDAEGKALQHELEKKMSIIVWSEQFSMKIPSIDDQHKIVFSLINRLKTLLPGKDNNEIVNGILIEMVDYIRVHFEFEEKHMTAFKFPLYDEHKSEHEEFIDKVKHFKRCHAAGRANMAAIILEYLSTWLGNHILNTDKKYIENFLEHGLK